MWRGGVGCPPIELRVNRAGSNKLRGVGACSATPNDRRALLALGESGTLAPLLTTAASARRRPSHAGADNAAHKVVAKTAEFRGRLPPHLMWEIQRVGGTGSPNASHRWYAAYSGMLLIVSEMRGRAAGTTTKSCGLGRPAKSHWKAGGAHNLITEYTETTANTGLTSTAWARGVQNGGVGFWGRF